MTPFQLTHLAALSAYYPYRPKVQFMERLPVAEILEELGGGYHFADVPFVGTLMALPGPAHAMVRHHLNDEEGDEMEITGLKLILRPFAALVEPLPDGTVPLFEMLKQHSATRHHPGDLEGYTPIVAPLTGGLCGGISIDYEDLGARYEFDADGGILSSDETVVGGYLDYLRSLHFAVGIPETSYILAR